MADLKERFAYAEVSKFTAPPVMPPKTFAALTALDRKTAVTVRAFKRSLSALGKVYEGTTDYALEVRVLCDDEVREHPGTTRQISDTRTRKSHKRTVAAEPGNALPGTGEGIRWVRLRLISQVVVASAVWMCSMVYRGIMWLTAATICNQTGSALMGSVRVNIPLDHRHLPFVLEEALETASVGGRRSIELVTYDLLYDQHSTAVASIVGCDVLALDTRGRPRRPPRPRRRRPPRAAAGPGDDVEAEEEGHEGADDGAAGLGAVELSLVPQSSHQSFG
jgi:hypothetical protein